MFTGFTSGAKLGWCGFGFKRGTVVLLGRSGGRGKVLFVIVVGVVIFVMLLVSMSKKAVCG